jgi:hypothetical protein
MKPGPGKIPALLLMLAAAVFAAQDYRFALKLSTQRLYEQAPLIVTFDVEQTDHSSVMFFDFNIKEEGRFKVYRLDKTVEQSSHHDKERYTYLVFPLKAGKQALHFDLLVMRANDDILTSSYTGGRYNVKKVDTTDTHESIPSETVDVLPQPPGTVMSGNFKVSQKVDKTQTQAERPVYLTRHVSGTGYLPDMGLLSKKPKIEGVRVFMDKPVIRQKQSPQGIEYDAVFRYALLSSKPFTIPSVSLKGFDPKTQKSYTTAAKGIAIGVSSVTPQNLVDRTDEPKPIVSPAETFRGFGTGLLIFAGGYLSALLVGRLGGFRRKRRPAGAWEHAVKGAADAKALLRLLIARDAAKYAEWIDVLEHAVYAGKPADLNRIKKAVISLG